MTRVSSQKTRQALLVTGDPLDADILPERLELFNEAGEPLMLGGGYSRHEQEEVSAGLIAPSATELDVFTASPGLRLYRIVTNRPARVRAYPTEEFRDADLSRPIGTKPHGNHGRLLEVVTTPDMLDLTLSPAVDFQSKEAFFSDYYVSITNLDSVAGAVVTTYHYIRTE